MAKGLSAYHFQIATNLAWFSNLTHIAGLTVLRKYLNQHPLEKKLRWAFMAVLAVMLLVSMGPTVFFNWPDAERSASNSTYYAGCLFNPRRALWWFELEGCYNHTTTGDSRLQPGTVCLPNWICTNASDAGDGHCRPHYSGHNDISNINQTSAFQSTVLSMVLLFLNFMSRTTKLLAPLSRFTRLVRGVISRRYLTCMRGLVAKLDEGQRSLYLKRYSQLVLLWFIICDLLLFRIYTDVLTSALSDVRSTKATSPSI